MTLENITCCPACGAEGGLYWQTTPNGAELREHNGAAHVCPEEDDLVVPLPDEARA